MLALTRAGPKPRVLPFLADGAKSRLEQPHSLSPSTEKQERGAVGGTDSTAPAWEAWPSDAPRAHLYSELNNSTYSGWLRDRMCSRTETLVEWFLEHTRFERLCYVLLLLLHFWPSLHFPLAEH